LSVCVDRDAKGLYTGAVGAMLGSNGLSTGSNSTSLAFHPFSQTPYNDLTGVSHPYEFPTGGGKGVTADITIDTDGVSTEIGVSAIVAELWRRGYMDVDDEIGTPSGTPHFAASDSELLFINWLKERDSSKSLVTTTPVSPQPKISFKAEKGGHPDPMAQLCTSFPHSWDSFSINVGKNYLLLHGGLPMKNSPAAHFFRRGISISRKPSQLHILLAPSSSLFNYILSNLNQSQSLALLEFTNERVKMSEEAGQKEFEKQHWLPSKDTGRPFYSVHLLDHLSEPSSYPEINTLDPWLLEKDNGGSAFTLPDPVALYASYDLWSLARWAHEESLPNPPLYISHPRLLFFLQHILRLDPCAFATVAIPREFRTLISNISMAVRDSDGSGGIEGDSSKISSYAEAYVQEVEEAAKHFPGRVRVFRV